VGGDILMVDWGETFHTRGGEYSFSPRLEYFLRGEGIFWPREENSLSPRRHSRGAEISWDNGTPFRNIAVPHNAVPGRSRLLLPLAMA